MILKLGIKHQALELYKVYINHDPGMTLTYYMASRISHISGEHYRTIGPLFFGFFLDENVSP